MAKHTGFREWPIQSCETDCPRTNLPHSTFRCATTLHHNLNPHWCDTGRRGFFRHVEPWSYHASAGKESVRIAHNSSRDPLKILCFRRFRGIRLYYFCTIEIAEAMMGCAHRSVDRKGTPCERNTLHQQSASDLLIRFIVALIPCRDTLTSIANLR